MKRRSTSAITVAWTLGLIDSPLSAHAERQDFYVIARTESHLLSLQKGGQFDVLLASHSNLASCDITSWHNAPATTATHGA